MCAQCTKCLVPCGLRDSAEPFSFVECGYWIEKSGSIYLFYNLLVIWKKRQDSMLLFVLLPLLKKMNGRHENLYLTFWSTRKRKTIHLYSLLSLFKLNDYCLHCDSKCKRLTISSSVICVYSLISWLKINSVSLCSSAVSSCSILYCVLLHRAEITIKLQSVDTYDPLYCCISFSPI